MEKNTELFLIRFRFLAVFLIKKASLNSDIEKWLEEARITLSSYKLPLTLFIYYWMKHTEKTSLKIHSAYKC